MHEYLDEHFHAIEFVLAICKNLKLSVLSSTTACILYHKVQYEQKQLKDTCLIDKYLVGPTCVYLASKIGEEALRIRDVVNISHGLLHPDVKPLEIGRTYWNLRDSITTCELMLLRLFAFDTAFETPQKYVLHYLSAVQNWTKESLEKWEESGIKHLCWSLVGDLCYLPHIATVPPHKLATAVIYIGLKQTELNIMESENENEKRWYKMLCPGLTLKDLKSLCCELLELFEWKIEKEKNIDEKDVVKKRKDVVEKREDVKERKDARRIDIDTEIQSSSKT